MLLRTYDATMSRSATLFLNIVAAVWLATTGAFLFVKGLDISLVACDERTCGDVADLVPGIAAFLVGFGMLLAWPSVAAFSDATSWSKRLGVGLLASALLAALASPLILAVTERLGILFWACAALISAITVRPPLQVRDLAIRGRAVVTALLAITIVAAEIVLDGDAYVLAFTMSVALTPPAIAGVDDFALGWQTRQLEPMAAVEPDRARSTGLRAPSEIDDAQNKEHNEQDPNDAVHEATS